MYIIKVTEKRRTTQIMSDMYGHRISKSELRLHENYLKVGRWKNMLLKKLKISNQKVLLPDKDGTYPQKGGSGSF